MALVQVLKTHKDALGKSSKHLKGSKERHLLGQKHNLHIFGVIPFVKLQNDT